MLRVLCAGFAVIVAVVTWQVLDRATDRIMENFNVAENV